jgi:PAS domain S-box-containing protein
LHDKSFSGSLPKEPVPTVQFYGDDGFFLHELHNYIGSALARGTSGIVIATSGHLENLSRKLSRDGVDLAKARTEDRFIAVEAAQALGKFMVDGRPDSVLFSQALGELIARAEHASLYENHRVVVFGEMVAVLWAEGKREAAIDLEKLWNNLTRTSSFALRCAYPMQGFSRQQSLTPVHIGSDHSAAVRNKSGWTVPLNSNSAAESRRWEESFRLFVEAVQDYAIFMLDPEGHVVTWNAGAERIKGYQASEIIGKHFSSFYPEEDVRIGKPEALLNEAAKEGRVEDEGWRVRKEGSKFWARVTITAVKGSDGRLLGFGKVTRDLTERKRNDLALQRSEERARLFVECVRDYAIFMLDPEGYVSTWNTGAERIKGYKANEIIGQHFSRFYPEDDIRLGKPAWELEVAKRDGRFEDEGWRLRKDGSKFWANVIITAIRDGSGTLLGFGKVTRDFTERMLAQKALQDSERKLERSEKSLRDLSLHLLRTQDEERRRIGREIHDSLGQYLAAVRMKLDMMSAAPDEDDLTECGKLVDECVKEVRTISYLLYPPMLEEMGLKSAVPWYLDGFSKRSGIETKFEISAGFRRLSRDAELVLFRVLQESLTNVQRHSGSKFAAVSISASEESAVLQITDHGVGMPPDILELGVQDWMGSQGVGLRGMKERLSQIGGTLDISSDQSGTNIRATVPLDRLEANAAG